MPVFRLTDELIFPPVELAEENGLIAVGGDLSMERLILGYSLGIFPWYQDNDPILWWSPDPRFIIMLDEFKIPKSLKRILNKKEYTITLDKDFKGVITNCRKYHLSKGETWITREMKDAYINLHNHGLAHSVEVWKDNILVGGLYGVSLGKIFFGESMFSLEPNTSKIALVHLVSILKKHNFLLIDSQIFTRHISLMGGKNIPRKDYLTILKEAIKDGEKTTIIGSWSHFS